MAKIPNPVKVVDGSALGEYLRQNKWPKPAPVKNGAPIVIPGGKAPRRGGAGGYDKGGRGG